MRLNNSASLCAVLSVHSQEKRKAAIARKAERERQRNEKKHQKEMDKAFKKVLQLIVSVWVKVASFSVYVCLYVSSELVPLVYPNECSYLAVNCHGPFNYME